VRHAVPPLADVDEELVLVERKSAEERSVRRYETVISSPVRPAARHDDFPTLRRFTLHSRTFAAKFCTR